MQFPTCKKPTKRDGVRVSTLFDEFASTQFTGYCKIILGKEEHVLALREGAYILAQSGDEKGVEAFRAIQDLGNSLASVIFCPLSTKQLEVTLLFNAPYRIIFTEQPERPSPKTEVESGPVTRIQPVSLPSTAGRSSRVRSIKIKTESEEEKKKALAVAAAREGASRQVKKIDQLTLESIKELKETFKTDAADLLRELHMEHLLQKNDKKSSRSVLLKSDK